jgi:hypothetical protein
VKEAEADWLIYHLLPEGASVEAGTLAEGSGLGMPEVEASLARLERSCIIERSGSSVRQLSVGEALLRNQLKYDKDLPFTLENGVIREKKRPSCQEKK